MDRHLLEKNVAPRSHWKRLGNKFVFEINGWHTPTVYNLQGDKIAEAL